MYGHAVTLAALTKPITDAHRALVEKVKEMYSHEDHPDLHELHHPSQIEMWFRTTRFKQLSRLFGEETEEAVDKELTIIEGILKDFARAA